MQFAVHCLDHPGAYPKRLLNYEAHHAHLATAPLKLVLSGPLLDPSSKTRIGSLLVVDAESLEQVQAFADADPFRRNGVWATVSIHPYLVLTDNR